LFLAIIIALVGAAVLGDKLFSDLEAQGKQGLSILTLSGRVSIWFEVIKDWQNNPIFGYGPDFLDVEHRLRWGCCLRSMLTTNLFKHWGSLA
ncbi:hypothetical protein, partial [Acinetobacter soli]|uniref:hypothetical protein n=1 Tax=Acinetobacter soli TaxID=487316 RepID=UPI00300D2C90